MRTLVLPILAVLACASVAEDTPPAVALTHPWIRFKPGSWVKFRTEARLSGDSMKEETKLTLTEIGAESYTLKIETSMGGNALPGTESKHPIVGPAAPDWQWEDKGTEDVEVAGQKLACKVRLGKSPDGKSSRQTWTAEVDGRPLDVKSTMKQSLGGDQFAETQTVKRLGEVVKVGGKDVKCWVKEVVREEPGQKSLKTFWESWDVPGMAVKSESEATSGTMRIVQTREVVEFEVK